MPTGVFMMFNAAVCDVHDVSCFHGCLFLIEFCDLVCLCGRFVIRHGMRCLLASVQQRGFLHRV